MLERKFRRVKKRAEKLIEKTDRQVQIMNKIMDEQISLRTKDECE